MSTNLTSIQPVILSTLPLDPMVFGDDLTPIEVRVSIKGEDYILREAGAGAAIAWNNARMRAAKMNDGKLSGFDNMFDADLTLLSMCLHRIHRKTGAVITDGQGNPAPTPIQTIRGWLNRVYQPLVERLKAISPGLEKEDTPETLREQIKNLQEKLADLEKKEAAKQRAAVEDDADGPPPVANSDGSETESAEEERAKN